MMDLQFRPAARGDLPKLQAIRLAAFAPVFASFRSLLGDELYTLVQAREDAAQADLLISLLEPGSVWEVRVASVEGALAGFVAFRASSETRVGEIGLNAVHPIHAGNGIGTKLYELALARMKELGMKAATVATGADASHAAARRAYAKVGFTAHVPSVWYCAEATPPPHLSASGDSADDAPQRPTYEPPKFTAARTPSPSGSAMASMPEPKPRRSRLLLAIFVCVLVLTVCAASVLALGLRTYLERQTAIPASAPAGG